MLQNVHKLPSLLGIINYYEMLVPNAATLLKFAIECTPSYIKESTGNQLRNVRKRINLAKQKLMSSDILGLGSIKILTYRSEWQEMPQCTELER
jgi:hypothetical protein